MATSVPQPRSPGFDFAAVPRHWFGGDPVATHLANGLNLLFPAGERMFVRSVRRYLDRLDEPTRRRVRGFFAQEGRHAGAHEQLNAAMEAQGLMLVPFLAWYERALRAHERRAPPILRLAVTAALEHYTAILAEDALAGDLLDGVDPAVRRLFLWHACEEIEHKAVAFDVLRQINPSYRVRMAGLVVATVSLIRYWAAGSRMLLGQERLGRLAALRGLAANYRRRRIGRRLFWRGIREYVRRDFHPDQLDNVGLARAWLAKEGLA